MRALKDVDIEPLIGLGPANPHYDHGCTPYTPQGRAGLARFAQEVLEHYGGQIKHLGVYNEPNGEAGDFCLNEDKDGPADSREDYHRDIAKAVYQAVPAEITVSAPELAGGAKGWVGKFEWLKNYLDVGGLENLDIVSLHTYRPNGRQDQVRDCPPDEDEPLCKPEGLLTEQINPVRQLLSDSDGQDKQIWITEMGWKSSTVGESAQAAYLPRAHVLAMKGGVTRFNWYNFRDHHDDTFGLIHKQDDPAGAYTPKPGYVAYAVMTSQLAGLTYQSEDEAPAGVHSYLFGGGHEPTRVMWSQAGSQTIQLQVDGDVRVTDIMGRTKTLKSNNGKVSLTVSGSTQYIHGDVGAITTGKRSGGQPSIR